MTRTTARDKRIRQANLRLIEVEIRNYPQTVRDLREMEEAIALPGVVGDPTERVFTVGPGDPTSARAIKLMSSAFIAEIRRRVAAIEHMVRVLEASPEKARYELVKLAYWDGRYTVKGICDKLNISERTYYYWRREALRLVAEKLGWEI